MPRIRSSIDGYLKQLLRIKLQVIWFRTIFVVAFIYIQLINSRKTVRWITAQKRTRQYRKLLKSSAPSTHIRIFFKTVTFFSVQKKGGSSRSVFESFSPVQVKTLKGWKYDSIPYRACVMLVVYDVWHHAVLRYCLSTRINEKQAFLIISTLRTIFEKKRLRCPKTLFKRERKAKTEKKNLRSKNIWKRVDEALLSIESVMLAQWGALRGNYSWILGNWGWI